MKGFADKCVEGLIEMKLRSVMVTDVKISDFLLQYSRLNSSRILLQPLYVALTYRMISQLHEKKSIKLKY